MQLSERNDEFNPEVAERAYAYFMEIQGQLAEPPADDEDRKGVSVAFGTACGWMFKEWPEDEHLHEVLARMFTISASIGLLQASGDEETASRLFVWVPKDGG